MYINFPCLTDSYKITHWKQYPPGTQKIYSYFESRHGEHDIVFFGLQYYLKEYLKGDVLTVPEMEQAAEIWKEHLGQDLFNYEDWKTIANLRYLPVSIKAVPEGTVVPPGNVLMTIENTRPDCFWLTNFLETLLVQVWYGSSVATLSRSIKKLILNYLKETGTPELIDFKLHDFGFRGVSSVESAGVGGAAHLINFKGTDTMAGIITARHYYMGPKEKFMPGFSIPASEHSTITSWGKESEGRAFENMLDQYPEGLVACVSDSFNIYKACADIWGTELKDKILKRKGTLVIRPDSGEPSSTILNVLSILGEKFGFTINEKGYKVLPPQIRIIQGDGVDYSSIDSILRNMQKNGWSADNIAFGMGGALLQKLHRDTYSFAFKCSNITVNNEEREVYKEPITDKGKNSKRGKLALIQTESGSYQTVPAPQENDLLVEVFRDGKILKEWNFDEIRKRASF